MSLAAFLHQRISPFSFAGRALRSPLRLVPGRAVVPVLSGVNRGQRWIAGSATAGCWLGIYEEDHQLAMKRMVRPGEVAYDVGANVGFYTLALARLVGANGRVYAFEPDARNADLLRQHVLMNRLSNVTIVQAAVGDRPGLVPFGGANEQSRVVAESHYLVPSITLDDFVAAGHPLPSFLKMDVEGAECDALAGASTILSKGDASWMVATHAPVLRKQCFEVFSAAGYSLSTMEAGGEVDESSDFLAIPKGTSAQHPLVSVP